MARLNWHGALLDSVLKTRKQNLWPSVKTDGPGSVNASVLPLHHKKIRETTGSNRWLLWTNKRKKRPVFSLPHSPLLLSLDTF